MKKEKLLLLATIPMLVGCSSPQLNQVNTNYRSIQGLKEKYPGSSIVTEEDYNEGVYLGYKYQTTTLSCTNYFLDDSIYTLNKKSFRLLEPHAYNYASGRNNDGFFTIMMEFDTSVIKTNSQFPIETRITIPIKTYSGNTTKTWSVHYSSLDELVRHDEEDLSFSVYRNCLYISFNPNCLNGDKWVLLADENDKKGFEVSLSGSGSIAHATFPLRRFALVEGHYATDEKVDKFVYRAPTKTHYGATRQYNQGDHIKVISSISDPHTIEELQQNLIAYDYGDQAIIQSTVEEEEDYLSALENHTPGDYSIIFTAIDSSSNRTVVVYDITLKDIEAPKVYWDDGHEVGGYTYRIPVSEVDTVGLRNDITKYLRIVDDYDENADYVSGYQRVFYYSGVNKVYQSSAYVQDSSGNMSSYLLTFMVYDDILPTIEGPDTITLTKNEFQAAEELLYKYEFSDNDQLLSFGIQEDGYTGHAHEFGTYPVTLYATDKSNNTVTKEISVVVKDLAGPVFYVNEIVIDLKNTDGFQSAYQLIRHAMNQRLLPEKEYVKCEYVNTEYEENYDKEGEYFVPIACYNEDGTKEYVNVTLKIKASESLNFFQRVGRWFSNAFKAVKNFFINIFNKIKSWLGIKK